MSKSKGNFFTARDLFAKGIEPAALRLLQLYCVAMVLERVALIPTVQLRYQLRFSDLLRVDLFGDAVYVTVTISAAVLSSSNLSTAASSSIAAGAETISMPCASQAVRAVSR